MSQKPVFSVIIPCYRAAKTLPRAVASVLAGAPDALEVLLIDDGSPRRDPGCLRCAGRAGPARARAAPPQRRRAAAARNTGLDAAAGEWVLFVDADDELLPGLWGALPSALAAAPGMILFGLTRQSGPAPCPLAPGVFPPPGRCGRGAGTAAV